MNGILYQKAIAKYTHNLNNRPVQLEVVFNNGDQTECDDCDIYLYSFCIFRFPTKGFYAEILLGPFEKQFSLPSIAVKKGNYFFFEKEIVGVLSEDPSYVRGLNYDAPE